jgi:pimeloyl-ACP methyl ester carboxylesterase
MHGHAILLYVAALAVALVMAAVWFVLARRFLLLTTHADALEWAETTDGWALSLHRYLPAARSQKRPLILCHGLGANRFNLDFDADYSLARFLRARGFDVFVLELRGCGLSRWMKPKGRRRPPAWNFDDMVRHDVPAAIARVRALTGASQVDWVGHSLGGMIMYAALSGEVASEVGALVAIGSPACFSQHRWLKPIARMHALTRLAPAAAGPAIVRWISPLSGRFAMPGLAMLANQRNMSGPVVRRALYNLVGPAPWRVLAQLAGFVRAGVMRSADGRNDYDAGFAHITTPALLIAGAADWLAPEYAVRYFFDRIASARKQLVVCGRAQGYSADYGHGDLVLGENAPQEIFPLVAEFLEG